MSDQDLDPSGPRHLDKLLGAIKDYVVMSDEQRLVVALWIVHAHMVEHFEQTPYLTVTSPQRQCGKSRLLELLELLVPRSWMAITPSEAVIYRYIDSSMPTLLLDEVDAIFAPKNGDRYEGIRAILNAGHRRGATVPRCVGTSLTPQNFRVYCAKVLAGIGVLPDTITDRSIPIRLQRKTRDEKVKRFRRRDVEAQATPIREALEAFAAKYGEALGGARPELPDELSDRMQEGCEPLLAIADAIGYGVEARAAMVTLLTGDRADEKESAQLRLLASIRDIFASKDVPAISTNDLTMALQLDGWGADSWYGRGINAQDLAGMLRPYEIGPKTVRVSTGTAKGYRRDDFHEAWTRYLAVTAVTAVTPSTEGVD